MNTMQQWWILYAILLSSYLPELSYSLQVYKSDIQINLQFIILIQYILNKAQSKAKFTKDIWDWKIWNHTQTVIHNEQLYSILLNSYHNKIILCNQPSHTFKWTPTCEHFG